MIDISASAFSFRKKLDNYVLSLPEGKEQTHRIVGSLRELMGLHLSTSSRVYGVRCAILDDLASDIVAHRQSVDRGQQTDFRINNKVKKIDNYV